MNNPTCTLWQLNAQALVIMQSSYNMSVATLYYKINLPIYSKFCSLNLGSKSGQLWLSTYGQQTSFHFSIRWYTSPDNGIKQYCLEQRFACFNQMLP